MLYLAGDLPLVEPADVVALVGSGAEATAVVGRAHDGGTNALWVAPAGALEPAFGTRGSATVHAARAVAAGLRVVCSTAPASPATSTRPRDLALVRGCWRTAPRV